MNRAPLGVSHQAKMPDQVRFGYQRISFSDELELKPVTVKLDGAGAKLAQSAIDAFKEVGLAMANSITEVAKAIKPYNPPMKEI
jgi:hypothetical protein